MRNITSILAIFFVLAATVVFIFNDSEKNRRNKLDCTCTSTNGTLLQECPVHGKVCLGFPAHKHENTRYRRTDLHIIFVVEGRKYLCYAPYCEVIVNHLIVRTHIDKKIKERREKEEHKSFIETLNARIHS